MLTTTTLHLRLAGAARPLSPFSRLYSIAANRTTTTRLASTTSRPFLPRPQTPSSLPHRHASTTASSAAPPSASTSSTSSHLTWNEYLRLRKVRRYYNLSFSIGLGLTTTFLGMGFLAQQNLQQLGQTFFGLDPFMVMGILTVAFAGVGWLAGPLAGSAVFRTMYRQQAGEMALKEKDFFGRIRKYRVDPSNSSMQNPVPDYYGEKITSVQGYRNWLKDQRAYNNKRKAVV